MADLVAFRMEWQPRMLSVLRFVAGLLYLQHGSAKIFDFPDFPPMPNHMPYNMSTLVPGVAGPLELIGGTLVALGLFTRPVAFLLSGEMAIAYFMSHAPRNFFPLLNGGDGAILYCFIFLYLVFAGGGPWSLDRLRGAD